MIVASGAENQDLYKGLYDFAESKKFINRFPKRIFKKLSSNMDEISRSVSNFCDADSIIYDLISEGKEVPHGQEQKREDAKTDFINIVGESERMIIDKILLPRLRRTPAPERQTLLDNYYGFIICEKDYFQRATGYQMLEPKKKSVESNPWLEHVDVDISAVPNVLEEDKSVKIEKDFND